MNEEQIRELVYASIKAVAPEVDPATLDPSVDLREEIDLDSMDFTRFVNSLQRGAGVDIPERDYRQLTTVSGAQSYLVGRLKLGS